MRLEKKIQDSIPHFTTHRVDKEAMLEHVIQAVIDDSEPSDHRLEQRAATSRRHRGAKLAAIWSAAAAIALVGVLTAGFASPALAQVMHELPVIGGLYSFPTQQSNRYLTHTSTSVTNKDIRVTISQTYYDGTQLFLVYQVHVPKGYHKVQGNQVWLNLGAVKLDGHVIGPGGFDGVEDSSTGADTFTGAIEVVQDSARPLPKKGTATVVISKIGNVRGPWRLSLPVSSAAVSDATRSLTLTHTATSMDGATLEIKKVSQGPIYTAIEMQIRERVQPNGKVKYPFTFKQGIGGPAWWFRVYANGSKYLDGDNEIASKAQRQGHFLVQDVTFECASPSANVRALKIEAFHWNPALTSQDVPGSVSIPITSNFPIPIFFPWYGTTDIDSIQYEQKRTLIHTHIEGDEIEHPDYWLQGPNGQVYKRIGQEAAIGIDTGVDIFPAIPKGEKLTIHATHQSDMSLDGFGAYDLHPDLSISVPLQKP